MRLNFVGWNYNEKHLVPNEAGIYVLQIQKALPKLYDIDEKGIMYIGRTANLKRRLRIVENADWKRDYDKKSHEMFDHSLLTFATDFDENYNLIPRTKYLKKNGILTKGDTLVLKYSAYRNSRELEQSLLRGHLISFGQLPPFNSHGASLKEVWNSEDADWDRYIETYKKLVATL